MRATQRYFAPDRMLFSDLGQFPRIAAILALFDQFSWPMLFTVLLSRFNASLGVHIEMSSETESSWNSPSVAGVLEGAGALDGCPLLGTLNSINLTAGSLVNDSKNSNA